MIGVSKRGPVPQPTSIQKLRGNPSRLNLEKRLLEEPEPPVLERFPDPPDELTEDAKNTWRTCAPDLFAGGTLLVSDIHLWREFCELDGSRRELKRQMAEDGAPNGLVEVKKGKKVHLKLHPNNTPLDRMFSRWLGLASHFGMTPASRSRIRVEKKRNKDPFEGFMNGAT